MMNGIHHSSLITHHSSLIIFGKLTELHMIPEMQSASLAGVVIGQYRLTLTAGTYPLIPAWVSGSTYAKYAVVSSGGNYWACNTAVVAGTTPPENSASWTLLPSVSCSRIQVGSPHADCGSSNAKAFYVGVNAAGNDTTGGKAIDPLEYDHPLPWGDPTAVYVTALAATIVDVVLVR